MNTEPLGTRSLPASPSPETPPANGLYLHRSDSAAYRNHFSGKYEYRLITGGIGHNLPQEAPQAFAQAVLDVDAMTRT